MPAARFSRRAARTRRVLAGVGGGGDRASRMVGLSDAQPVGQLADRLKPGLVVRFASATSPVADASALPRQDTGQHLPWRVFFSTLPSSGSLAIMVMKFSRPSSVMCGGSGGTFGSV